jgi:LPXTG-motif cell wall-anchored protein
MKAKGNPLASPVIWIGAALLALLTLWGSGPKVAGAAEEYTVLRTIDVPVPVNPEAIVVNPDTGRLYYIDFERDVRVIDTLSDEVLATLPAKGTTLAINRGTNRLYISDWVSGKVSVVDGATNKLIKEISVGDQPTSIAVNASTNRIYVNESAPKISVIDGTTNAVIDEIDQIAGHLAVDPTTNLLYATGPILSSGPTPLAIIDGTTNQRVGEVQVGPYPSAVEVDPTNGNVFVATGINDGVGPGQIWIVDAGSRSVRKTVPMDVQIVALGVNVSTHSVYAVNFYTDAIAVFDASGSQLATVHVGAGPSNIAVDELHDLAYVSTGNARQISVIGASSVSGLPALGGSPETGSDVPLTLLAAGLALTVAGGWLFLSLRRSR